MTLTPFLTRVRVKNFRSLSECDVRLGPLTVLAGPNAAGKSNFIDAIRFVRDALRSSPGQVLESRGGLAEVLHRSTEGSAQADSFTIRLDAQVPDRVAGTALHTSYHLEVGFDPRGGGLPVLRGEEVRVSGGWRGDQFLPARAGEAGVAWRDHILLPRSAPTDADVNALYVRLREMRFHELLTPALRVVDDTPASSAGNTLGERGEHLPRVLSALAREWPWAKETIDGYVSTMVDNAAGLDGVEVPEGDLAFVVGRFVGGDGLTSRVDRRSLSEGTLRLAGVLAALFQPKALTGEIPLVAIEEPEVSLHPPMLGALYDALLAASRNTQVMVTTQSADLLDNASADPGHVVVVHNEGSGTSIGPIDAAGRHLLDEGVLTLPELLRSGELRPAPTPVTTEQEEAPE
ncbi:AAA family ATPase [Streptomyces sp. 549]|uniref:AAA family ATPase n=1 Tax=Streptomyces sp. 549 TaxID=3049076 RepID=UPI0024C319C7|nr:AAA family ATPase [Streptomyces sp. 549]